MPVDSVPLSQPAIIKRPEPNPIKTMLLDEFRKYTGSKAALYNALLYQGKSISLPNTV
jgi:hypothetical protein